MHVRKSLGFLEETMDKNMDIKDTSGETSDGNKECVIGHWRKEDPYK